MSTAFPGQSAVAQERHVASEVVLLTLTIAEAMAFREGVMVTQGV